NLRPRGQRALRPFRRANENLPSCTYRARRVVPQRLDLGALQFALIKQRGRLTLANRLPAAAPFFRQLSNLGAVRSAPHDFETKSAHPRPFESDSVVQFSLAPSRTTDCTSKLTTTREPSGRE